jgi:hypothetical protein
MRVVCAWCQQEGRSRLLRVGEPLEDTSETHGICNRHQQEIFEMFPSRSFPSTRWLFIASSDDARAYRHLVAVMRDISGVTVIMERRHGERRRGEERRGAERPAQERRHADRRIRHPERNSLGYMLVRFSRRDVAAPPRTLPNPPADRGGAAPTESALKGMTLLQATA